MELDEQVEEQEPKFETQVYIFDTKNLADKSVFDALYKTVPEYRQKKIDFYQYDKDKRLSLGVGLVLSYALEKAGFAQDELEWAYKESGKPYFKNNEEIQFCLSHSEERAMCAISTEKIGCDVEFITPDNEVDVEQWTKIESYAKASDIELSSLLDGKKIPDSKFIFRQIELNDGYKYTICSQSAIGPNQIWMLKLQDFLQ